MADAPETPVTEEELVLTEDDQIAPPAEEIDEEEEVPVFGDSPEEELDTDNATIRHLRQTLKQTQKELSEVRRAAPSQAIEVGEKPTLVGCDYDEDKFEAELDAWKDRKAKADSAQQQQHSAAEEQTRLLAARVEKFEREKAGLGRTDADDATETVKTALGEAKFIGILGLLDDSTDAGKFMYALARNPTQLEALSSQQDGIRLVKDITRLEGQLKMAKRRTAAAIDTPERGSGKVSSTPGAGQKQLAKLKAEAEETGDHTKYFELKRKLAAK